MQEHVHLLDLPIEALSRILAGSGAAGAARAGAACIRLREVFRGLSSYTCFASASSEELSLADALRDATARAMTGMMGYVDFALVFVSKHNPRPLALGSIIVPQLVSLLPQVRANWCCCHAALVGVLHNVIWDCPWYLHAALSHKCLEQAHAWLQAAAHVPL